MKAVIVDKYGSVENMRYTDVEMPSIRSNQILIRVKTTSVNFADIKARYGNKGQAKLPFILGLEAAGIIEKVGSDVKSFSIGQRVLAFPQHGSYAEYVVANEDLTFAIPDRIRFDTAGACGIVSFLSYKLLADIAKLQKGENILIHSASGGVGTTAIQIAKALGAKNIIGTVGNKKKIPMALSAGADHTICYEQVDFADKVNELTDGKGVDVILDSIGGDITEQSLTCLADFGRLVVFGNSSGEYGQIKTNDLHASCRSVLGFSFGTTRRERPEIVKETAVQVFRLLESGQLDIKISERLPLKEASLAHQFVESRNSTGKVLLYLDN
ncbi:NADPH:quinone oxidoreductase family protein [Paenibacillus sp. MSJ-34]|uniref:quinone oxidoreductase family protein n=1 Tax=Paenibacillus sp. MSJ-34 TaxID=2841529 RepID=UPI001C10755D|nr:NADPH:quinone oxidoreductase family protein [Paenibacillus sp. MSJ-34]MBU5445303.1 NADPH:quinone oxidoreductase family protein [Paenibacillus sp. MSJ-34]